MIPLTAPSPLIFYVEDNPGDVFLLRTAFLALDLPVRLAIAGDGEEALRYLSDATLTPDTKIPDLILLDLNLPRLTGFDVLERLIDDDGPLIAVAVLSSSSVESDCQRAIALGAVACLRKPDNYEGYLSLVGRIYLLIHC